MTDITRNIRFRRDILANITVYDYYDIVEGETPEIVSEKIYGNAKYHWIIMLANDRYDYLNDWPLTQANLDQYVIDKYGSSANSVHHYENANGVIVSYDYPSAVPITNANYEAELNESKRRIKIISKDLISTILKNYKESSHLQTQNLRRFQLEDKSQVSDPNYCQIESTGLAHLYNKTSMRK